MDSIGLYHIESSLKAQFYELCRRSDTLAHFVHLSFNVKLKGSKFRGLAWKLFLGVLGPDKENWVQDSKRSREEYQNLSVLYNVNPRDPINVQDGDPLSGEEDCQDDTWRNKFK